ncbi:MAG: DNA gyrase subunit A [Promethearchaeota archaeon]
MGDSMEEINKEQENKNNGNMPNKLIVGEITEHLKSAFLDYAYSVIKGRALPDVRDGLKPVHRRIIYTCYENKFTHNNPFKKSARIVGDVMGKYHPHGDQSVYMTLVRMGQDFSLRYPLIEAQGNFGSIDGDPPAAQRYTEARLSAIASEMIADIEKDTVDFMPNYDESLQEPQYLPSKIPNLLMNGSMGIAVGMQTKMPPYNLCEIVDGIVAVIDNPNIYPEELNDYIKGPDFPTGGIIMGRKGIRHIINTGRGKIILRGRVEIEQDKDGQKLIITEIPYTVNKSKLVEAIANLINNKKITGVSDLRDESSRKGIRIVLELNSNADPNAIKFKLFKETQLEIAFHVVNLVLVNGGLQPAVLNIKELIVAYINTREEVIIRRTQFDLRKASKRVHTIEGLLVAINNIDDIVNIIKNAKDSEDAKNKIINKFALDEEQVQEILNMPLRRLTALQTQKLIGEKSKLEQEIIRYNQILANKDKRMQIIKDELTEIKNKYGDARRTKIVDYSEEENNEESEIIKTIPEETCVVVLTKNQYIKRMKLEEYRTQMRGGKGKKGIKIYEEDFIQDLFVVSSHDKLLLFTKNGRVYSKYAYEIPLMGRNSRGKALINFVGLRNNEKIVHVIPISDYNAEDSLIFATKYGMVKKVPIKLFKKIRRTGILAIKLREGDQLVSVKLNEGDIKNYILLATKLGYAVKFSEMDLRPLGRTALGVKGITLRDQDCVVDMIIGPNDIDIITITKNGYGKRSKLELYRETHRGGKGVINIKFHSDDDYVIAVKSAMDEELLIATIEGMIIRIPSASLRSLSRSARGVKLINLSENDFVSSVAVCKDYSCEDEGIV